METPIPAFKILQNCELPLRVNGVKHTLNHKKCSNTLLKGPIQFRGFES